MRHHVQQWSSGTRILLVQVSTIVVVNLCTLAVGLFVYDTVIDSELVSDPPAGWEYSLDQWGRLLVVLMLAIGPVLVTLYMSAWLWRRCLIVLGFTEDDLLRFPYPFRRRP